MSFLQRFTSDATNACNDAYSSWVLGDDAGKSATLTLCLRPTSSSRRSSSSTSAAPGGGAGGGPQPSSSSMRKNGIANATRSNNNNSTAAYYTNTPATTTVKGNTPPPYRLELGMSFLEINGRAYVKSVQPGSVAAMAGILPQDAVQYATVYRREWRSSSDIKHDQSRDHATAEQELAKQNQQRFSPLRKRGTDPQQQRKGAVDYDADDDAGIHDPAVRQTDVDAADADVVNSKATQYALDLESRGMRISYDELRLLLVEAIDPTQSAFLSPPTMTGRPPLRGNGGAAGPTSHSSYQYYNNNQWRGPPIPSTVNVCVHMDPIMSTDDNDQEQQSSACGSIGGGNSSNRSRRDYKRGAGGGNGSVVATPAIRAQDRGENHQQQDSDEYPQHPPVPYSGEASHPVVFVFRRTRQRKAYYHHLGIPAFRLDDECDLAKSLVQRLAPTADMEVPAPDTWEELVHDGTDWLLGRESMLPPRLGGGGGTDENNNANNPSYGNPNQNDNIVENGYYNNGSGSNHQQVLDEDDGDKAIPLDYNEKERARKLAMLRSRMAFESMQLDPTNDVEAATIRGMIQKAVGLAFVRASKVVLGISVHGGSGVVIARLSDGTWSAPSAIGLWGVGLGLQFGLEVAEYIFILQTQEAVDHFRRGGSFTVGGNMGLAIAGLGREAYGAASIGGMCGTPSSVKDDEYNDCDSRVKENAASTLAIAPIVAYAKSQGLYVGVSLEGSRIFSRDDINRRTYKFDAGRDVSAYDILSGRVSTPTEAEDLYAALHSVEFQAEMSCLPRPPEVLRKDSTHAWYYDQFTLRSTDGVQSVKDTFPFLSTLTKEESIECETFETQFKNFMYGGVSVQRLLPGVESRSGRTGKERRTLWLMLPEVGSLRLGYVSKLSDGEGTISNKSSTQRARRDDPSRISGIDGDMGTVGSEEVTLDSALNTKDGSTIGPIRSGNVRLSDKHSVALTDVTVISQDPIVPIRFKGEDRTEHLRVISIQDVSGTHLLFLANNFREAELLVCGLKLLLERETTRLGVRGGLPLTAFGGRYLEGSMSPSAARGFRDFHQGNVVQHRHHRKSLNQRRIDPGWSSELGGDGDDSVSDVLDGNNRDLSENGRPWGQVPGRAYMRQAAAVMETADSSGMNHEQGVPQYIHGQPIVREIVKNVKLPLPLPLCRVLLLDSTSPVIRKWERDRGDVTFEKALWSFPPSTPRDLERHKSEHQLIASGSMCGAHRTIRFDRPRYGSLIRLSEIHTVDTDDSKKVAFTVMEKNPRRGFSIKVRTLLRVHDENSCDANVFAEIRPVGKNMSNQATVHKAFLLVLDEIKLRYGIEPNGLLAGFLSVVDDITQTSSPSKTTTLHENALPKSSTHGLRPFVKTGPTVITSNNTTVTQRNSSKNNNNDNVSEWKEKDIHRRSSNNRGMSAANPESGLISLEDMLKTGRQSPEDETHSSSLIIRRPSTPSINHHVPEIDPSKRLSLHSQQQQSGATNSIISSNESAVKNTSISTSTNAISTPSTSNTPALIEVRPLPKIRLSLMPSPREEDEENSDSSPIPSNTTTAAAASTTPATAAAAAHNNGNKKKLPNKKKKKSSSLTTTSRPHHTSTSMMLTAVTAATTTTTSPIIATSTIPLSTTVVSSTTSSPSSSWRSTTLERQVC